ncbi:MAG: penicillin-binding protein 2 [Chloroflexi bacterium]|nr:penicillin-binding protein 2 [Chloroflexota bacterium]
MAAVAQPQSPQQQTLRRRLPFVIAVLVFTAFTLLIRLVWFQSPLDGRVLSYLETIRDANYRQLQSLPGERGNIYDRDGQPLAVNALRYEVGISPSLISNPRRTATQLAAILNLNELDIYNQAISDQQWVLLARPVSAEIGQQIAQLDILGVIVTPIPFRSYPQGTLGAQVIGFVAEDPNGLRGYYGVEGYYEDQLEGRVRSEEVSNIPLDIVNDREVNDRGDDLVLTIDRDIQYLAESELNLAINATGATGGTILIMDPRTGDILAMASYPSFDPNNISATSDPDSFRNPTISNSVEPGSIMKVVTVAAALESGVITPNWTYNDQGIINIGGIDIRNWNRTAAGAVDVTQVLVQSLNVGAATISLTMGPDRFFAMMQEFGFGQPTGVDLQGEEAGLLYVPGDAEYSESLLGTVAFGQGISVTPLQMLTAVNAIANGGLMMQPRIVTQIIDDNQVINSQPTVLGRPISSETAQIVTQMMVRVVQEGVDGNASVPGYTIAGKTGTAQIPTPVGYEENASLASFVGFFPADDPQVSVLVMLERPQGYWGSATAAPVFARLAARLAILLEIPQDAVRLALLGQGGSIDQLAP